jgi:hypothetical protein
MKATRVEAIVPRGKGNGKEHFTLTGTAFTRLDPGFKRQSDSLQLPLPNEDCGLPGMTKENWWVAAKIFLGLPLLFYALLSVLEPQREIWRKPTKKVLIVFIVAWVVVFCFIALIFAWNGLR